MICEGVNLPGIFTTDSQLSSPRAQSLSELLQRVLDAHAEHTASELAVSLGVDRSYVAKLRTGWRPARVREDLHARLVALDPAVRERGSAAGAQFYDGVLFAAEAMSATVTRLLAEARAGLHRGPLTPSAGEVVVGMQALDAAAAAEVSEHPPRRRKGRAESA